MDKIIVTSAGITLLLAVYWFFFGIKDESTESKTAWNITVDGGYAPMNIRIPKGKQSTITLTRNDPNSCLEQFMIPEFRVNEFLPLHTPTTITLSPTKSGTFIMHCAMNMYKGKIIVV